MTSCPNAICDGNCPMCLPAHEPNPRQTTTDKTTGGRVWEATGPLKIERYDCLLLSKTADECLGLYSTLHTEALMFSSARQVPDAALLRRLPHTKVWDYDETTAVGKYVGGKMVVKIEGEKKKVEDDWRRIWKRLALILKSNILTLVEDQVTYRFGTFSLAQISALVNLHPSSLAPNQDLNRLVLY